MKNYKQAFGN